MSAPDVMAQNNTDIEMIMNASAYYVAKHYNLSMGEVWRMKQYEFCESLAFASAADKIKQEEIDKMSKESKGKMRVAGTDAGQPMPFSD
ncbi:MAG: hypothetical protein HOC79_04520 [Euryarchaeota archaeon]|jgi:hypothetical protein|nr:hypothetical protein [Euryarchaeota archaeon]